MRTMFLVAILTTCAHAQTVTFGIAADGAVTGWQFGRVTDPAAIGGPSTTSLVTVKDGIPTSEKLGSPMDDMLVHRWRWTGSRFEVRQPSAILQARRRKMVPHLIELRQRLDAARALQSADPSSVTTADVQAIQAELDRTKAIK